MTLGEGNPVSLWYTRPKSVSEGRYPSWQPTLVLYKAEASCLVRTTSPW